MEPRIKVPRPKVTKGFITRSARRELELMKTHQVKSSWVLFTLNQTVGGGVWSDRYPPELSFPTRLWRRKRAVWWKRSLCGSSLRRKNLLHDLQPLRWKTPQRYSPHSCCTQFRSSFWDLAFVEKVCKSKRACIGAVWAVTISNYIKFISILILRTFLLTLILCVL